MINISSFAKFIPSVEKPILKQGFNTRMKWTLFALLMYLALASITVYGIGKSAYEQFRFFEIVLGSKFGSLMTLGIGPIVTAGILMQLLVGSKILDWDMTKPEYRKKFQTTNKLLAIFFCFFEAIAFVLAGAVPVEGGIFITSFAIFQLAMGGIIVIMLDDLVSKWGFGSGVSLFIAAGVGSQIFIGLLSPVNPLCEARNIASCIPSMESPPSGLLWGFLMNILSGKNYEALVNFVPIVSTAAVFLIVVYAQAIKVNVPLAFSALRGFGRTWSLKLFYTSVIPVILASALLANLQIMGSVGTEVNELGLSCSLLGCFDQNRNPVSGVVYYLSAPRNLLINIFTLNIVQSELLRAFTYTLFMVMFTTIFSVFWVKTAGMDAASVANQIESIGLQIPGFRRDKRIIESVLNRYIPALAVLGGFFIGLLAAFADFMGVIGSGTGMLLLVMIVYNYYEELRTQKMEEAHPLIRKAFGE